jgi:hypothetical protein
MRTKVDKKNKKNHHKERVFEKNEDDFYKDFERMELRKKHKEIYGVETFDSDSEKEKIVKENEIVVI